MSTFKWMTYAEAAEAGGIGQDAVSKRVSSVRKKRGGYWNLEWGDPPQTREFEFVSVIKDDGFTYCWFPPNFKRGRRSKSLEPRPRDPETMSFMKPPVLQNRTPDPEPVAEGEFIEAVFEATMGDPEPEWEPECERGETEEEAAARFEEESKRLKMAMKYDTAMGPGFFNRGSYYYVRPKDGSEDYYIFSLEKNSAPYIMSGEKFRQMWVRYVSKKATIDMVCLEFGIDRKRFMRIKHLVALTKTQPPFTHEEFATLSREEIERRWAAHRKSEIAVDVEARVYRDTKKAAGKWYAFEKHNREVWESLKFVAPILPRLREKPEVGDFEIIIGASDWHINKRPNGRTVTLEESTRFLYEMAPAIVEQVLSRHGTPRRWNIVVGSDLTQSDSYDLKTTRGTPQGPQCIGSHAAAEREAIRVMSHLIDVAHSVAPVRAVKLPGNHDRNTTSSIFNALEQRYLSRDSIEFMRVNESDGVEDETAHPLFFIGPWPCYGTHGDSIKKRDMPNVALTKALKYGATRTPLVFHGHWHNEGLYFDYRSGVWRISLPSLSVTDDWHELMGFDSAPMGCAVLRVNHDNGLDGLSIIRGNP